MSKVINKIRGFFVNSRKVLRHAKRPSRRELSITTKMSAIGILIIGVVGYVLNLLFNAIINAINSARSWVFLINYTKWSDRMPIYALRTTIGQEHSLSEHLARRAEIRSHLKIFSVLVPGGLKGYIFVEADSIDAVELLVEGMRHVRKRPRASRAKEIPLNELDHFLIPRPVIEGVDINDIVEVINGPFKGSRARVLDINIGKEEVTVELLALDLQIPVTISGESIRVVEKSVEKEPEDEYLL